MSWHLALQLPALLAAVSDSEIAGLLSIAATLVHMARNAAESSITAKETVGNALAAAFGRDALAGLQIVSGITPKFFA